MYDSMNRLISSTDPLGGLNTYVFDHAGNRLSFTDAKTNTYSWTYNYLNQKTSATYPDNSTEQWVYAASENLSQYTNTAGKVKAFTFDSRNRLTSWSWNTGDQYADTANYQYDAAGKLLQVGNSYSTVTNTYNAANELTSQTQAPVGGTAQTINYQYNQDGRRSFLAVPNTTYAIQYDYDTWDRVSGILDGSGNTIAAFGYDAAANRLSRVVGNSVATAYTYDQLNRLSTQTESYGQNPAPGNIWIEASYIYDSVSRITNVTYDSIANNSRIYGYDLKDQLNSIEIEQGLPPFQNTQLNYDLAGNRTQLSGSSTTNYNANNLNQYTAIGSLSPTYDAQHNLSGYNGGTFTYDWNRHLFSATNGPSDVESRYDGLGRCICRTVNGVVTCITYDGWNPILETNSAGRQTAARIYGVGVDELIEGFGSAGSTGYYYKQDNVGNVTALTASSGAVLELYTYDPFGHVTIYNASGTQISSSAYGNRFMFQGREYLAAVNTYDFRNRAYSPDLGRFLQMDPIGFGGGNHLYRFVGNNPVTGRDPVGLDTEENEDDDSGNGGSGSGSGSGSGGGGGGEDDSNDAYPIMQKLTVNPQFKRRLDCNPLPIALQLLSGSVIEEIMPALI
jgi:RHS repeat-associated protein